MTIKFEYICDNCKHDYIEQRADDELNPFFTICLSCRIGEYKEINQTVIE